VPSAEDRDEWVRVRLGRVHGRLLAEPLERGAGVLTSLVRADGLVVIPVGSHGFGAGDKVEVSLLVDPAELESTIVLAGPGDPALGILAGALRSGEAKRSLALRETGPAAGLVALSKGLCHVAAWAPLRSRGSEAGELEGVVADLALGAVRLGRRQLGLLVAPGNPLGLESIADIARLKARYANRRQGTSTRALFDGELDLLGVGKLSIRGYEREERSHLAVAAAVASGRYDCGLAVFAAARAFGLGFVPVTDQPYDLVVDSQMFEDALLEPLWLLVSSSRFRLRLEALGGYDTTETGKRVL
jgi:putative molybdopterin biosynthesis protein